MSRLAATPAPADGAGANSAKTRAAAAPSGLLALAKHPVVTYLLLLGQFALLWRLAIKFNLESAAFVEVLGVCVGAFAVHYWLPRAWRMAFFVAVSLLCVFLVFSWDKGGREFG